MIYYTPDISLLLQQTKLHGRGRSQGDGSKIWIFYSLQEKAKKTMSQETDAQKLQELLDGWIKGRGLLGIRQSRKGQMK